MPVLQNAPTLSGLSGDTAAHVSDSTVPQPLALTALALCVLAVWILQHPYLGIFHDSTLYTLFALTRLHPDQLASDIFLRFGSQDRYTLFTPIYAAAINSLGLEQAARLMTLICQAALLASAWLLGRRLMSPLAATLGVALLAAVPGEYGSADIFHILEGFITPRLPAEALAVGGLVAALGQRYWLAAFCVAAAMLLHPIIGCAGAAMLTLTFVAPLRPKLFAAAAGAGLLAGAAAVLVWGAAGRVDGMWLYSVRITSSYLFLRHWSSNDWSRIVVPLAILAVGALNDGATPLLRRLCAAALAMAGCGLLISVIFGDLLQVPLFLGAQTWRWLWLASLIAFVLTPLIATECWYRGERGQTAILFLVSAWMLRGTEPALYLVPLAIAAAATPDRWTTQRNWRLVFLAACVLTGLVAVLDLTDRLWYIPEFDPSEPALPQRLRAACSDGVIPTALVITACWVLSRWDSIAGGAVVAALAALACCALLPLAWKEWTYSYYTPELAGRFAPWRARIPARAEVLWPDIPVGSWYLLERPSYWSPYQSAGAIFSKDKALLLQRRTAIVAAAIGPPAQMHHAAAAAPGLPSGATPINLDGMKVACADPDLSYIVSWMPVAPTPYTPVIIDGGKLHGTVYLYHCADLLH